MNKGKRLLFCKECNRKRYCTKVSIPGYNFKYTCSRGHTWVIKGVTGDRVIAIMQEVMLPNIKDLFDRDDTFYRSLK